MFTPTHTHTHAHTHIHTPTHTCTHTQTHTQTHTHAHTRTRTHTHTHTHHGTPTRTHMHTHTHTCSCSEAGHYTMQHCLCLACRGYRSSTCFFRVSSSKFKSSSLQKNYTAVSLARPFPFYSTNCFQYAAYWKRSALRNGIARLPPRIWQHNSKLRIN